MKKLIVILLICFCFSIKGNAQVNLVPNASFETIVSCPNSGGLIYFAPPWFQPNNWLGDVTSSSNSELFDSCGTGPIGGIPTNPFGYQNANTGHAYAGIVPFVSETNNWQEYIEVPLISPLIANGNYCIEFYVSLADDANKAISNLGVFFSVDSLIDSGASYDAIDYVSPQFENLPANMLNDKTNWILISGSFIAAGGEKFMTLGNFHLPTNTNFQDTSGATPYAYYYIDDISVMQCAVGLKELNFTKDFTLSPNPTNKNFTIDFNNVFKNIKIEILDLFGKEIKTIFFTGKQITIETEGINSGTYFVRITDENKHVVNKRIVIQ